MVWIKICGITNIDDAKQITTAGADALGFILSTDSPRRISDEKLISIISELRESGLKIGSEDEFSGSSGSTPGSTFLTDAFSGKVSFVGVFVNEEIERILKLINKNLFDFIQFSGSEDLSYMQKIRSTGSNIKVIKLIRVSDTAERGSIHQVMQSLSDGGADFFLLDTFNEGIYGGTGRVFNWHLIENIGRNFPVILAGGLQSQNVIEALNIVKPFGIDASSRLEMYPGKKDIKKTREFIEKVRGI